MSQHLTLLIDSAASGDSAAAEKLLPLIYDELRKLAAANMNQEIGAGAGQIHFMHYNFCRIHKTLRVTPAMEAKLADHVWELAELVGILKARERAIIGTEVNKRGSYRPRQISD